MEPTAKRPRVGRPPQELLKPVEDETVLSGRPRLLRALLLHVGQPQREGDGVAGALREQAADIADAFDADAPVALEALFDSVVSLPAHTPLLACLTALAARRSTGVGGAVSSLLSHRLASALTAGDADRAKLLLRFLAALGAAGALGAPDVAAQLHGLVLDAEHATGGVAGAGSSAPESARREASALLYSALSALPFFAVAAGSVGACDPAVADDLDAALAIASPLVLALERSSGHTMEGITALTQARQRAAGGWLDVPAAKAAGLPMEALAAGSLGRLCSALGAALAGSAPADGGAPAGGSRYCALAVPTLSRPQDDDGVVAALRVGADSPAPYAAVRRGGDGAYAVAQGAPPAPAAGTAPTPAPLPPASRWFIRHPLTLFGPGGITSTPAVMTSLRLTGPAASPLALWAVRELSHDIILAFNPFAEATAEALLSLPMGAVVLPPGAPLPADDPRPLPTAPLAVEAALTQALWSPSAPFSPAYYGRLMLLLLQVAARGAGGGGGGGGERDGAPPAPAPAAAASSAALSIGCRALWKYAGLLDDAVATRLAGWVAFHASHLGWAWLWADMAPALRRGMSPSDPQRRFLRALLSRSFALIGPWQHDRIVPTAFKPLTDVDPSGVPPSVTSTAVSALLQDPPRGAGGDVGDEVAGAAGERPDGGRGRRRDSGGASGGGVAGGIVDHEMPSDEVDVLRATAPGAVVAHSTGSGDAYAGPRDGGSGRGGGDDDARAEGLGSAEAGVPPHLREFAGALLAQLRSKAEAGALSDWMAAAAAAAAGSGHALTPEQQLLALAHAVLVYGAANFKHAATLIERYRPLLCSTHGLPGAGSHAEAGTPASAGLTRASMDDLRAHLVLAAVEQVWHARPHMVAALAGLLVDGGVVTAAQVAGFAVAPAVRFPSSHFAGRRDDALHGVAAADLPGHHVMHRLAGPRAWELLHDALERSAAAARRAGVELAAFRGDKCYDAAEVELTEEAAVAREAALVAGVRDAAAARDAATLAAVDALVRSARALEAHVWHLDASAHSGGDGGGANGDDTPAATREVLRVALAHLRAVLDVHAAGPMHGARAHVWRAALVDVLASSSGVLAHTREFRAAAGAGALTDPEGDLAAAAVHAALQAGCPPAALRPVPVLLRDRACVVPDAGEAAY